MATQPPNPDSIALRSSDDDGKKLDSLGSTSKDDEQSVDPREQAAFEEWRRDKLKSQGPGAVIYVSQEVEARHLIRESLRAKDRERVASNPSPNFFECSTEPRAEIIEGLLREGNLANLAGPFGMGKSPLIIDLTVRLINGHDFCGRKLARRPVIAIDCETDGGDYKRAVKLICTRLGLPIPRVPEQLDVFLEHGDAEDPRTSALLEAVSKPGHEPMLRLIRDALKRKPNAVVFIDPLEMVFRLDTNKKAEVLALYREMRTILARFPNAAILSTFNLRKMDKTNGRADLLSNPRSWLEEICGSLDISNRSDVRLGIDCHTDDVRVINGIIRGREMHPILIRSVQNTDDQLAGFEQVTPNHMDLVVGLSSTLRDYWNKLPREFKFEDVADKLVPRSTVSRLVKRTISLGALTKNPDGTFRKTV